MSAPVLYTAGVSDPNADWALTRKTLVVEALLAGEALLVSCSQRPDRSLIGKQIYLHCGASLPRITPLRENEAAQTLITRLGWASGSTAERDDWRTTLDFLQDKFQGQVRGRATLKAAFVSGGAHTLESGQALVSVYKPDAMGHRYFGAWQDYVKGEPFGKARRQVPIGSFDRPTLNAERSKYQGTHWVWCFEAPERCDPLWHQRVPGSVGKPARGQCGVWDLRRWAQICRDAETKSQKQERQA